MGNRLPLLEYDEDAKRYVAAHHPFTSPKQEDISKLDSEPQNAQANAYDIVLNGYELGGDQSELQTVNYKKNV